MVILIFKMYKKVMNMNIKLLFQIMINVVLRYYSHFIHLDVVPVFSEEAQRRDSAIDQLAARLSEPREPDHSADKPDGETGV